jgi:hypothetical protein
MRVCRAFRGPEHWAFQIFRLGGGDASHEMDSEKDVGGIPGIASGDNPFPIEDFGRAERTCGARGITGMPEFPLRLTGKD